MTLEKAIDPGRIGLSKSLMTTPCARKAFYGETVRDAQGRRLSFPMPERPIFGRAVDVAVDYIVFNEAHGQEWSPETAVALGLDAAADMLGWDDLADPETFAIQVRNAVSLYLSQPDGLARLRPDLPGIRRQGDDGRSLRAGDVIGTPDFLLADGSVLDVKTSGARYSEAKFWRSPEMPVYAFLAASEAGVIPPRLIYQVYVRNQKPYWQWVEVAGSADLIELGKLHAAHWRSALLIGNVELFAFDTTYCAECPWRAAMPEVGHDGCRIGQLVPTGEEVAA